LSLKNIKALWLREKCCTVYVLYCKYFMFVLSTYSWCYQSFITKSCTIWSRFCYDGNNNSKWFLKRERTPSDGVFLKVQKTVYCTHNKQKRTGLLLLAFKTNIHLLRQRLICAKFFPFSTPSPIPLSDQIELGLKNKNKEKNCTINLPFDEVYFLQFGNESSIEIKFRFQQMGRRSKFQSPENNIRKMPRRYPFKNSPPPDIWLDYLNHFPLSSPAKYGSQLLHQLLTPLSNSPFLLLLFLMSSLHSLFPPSFLFHLSPLLRFIFCVIYSMWAHFHKPLSPLTPYFLFSFSQPFFILPFLYSISPSLSSVLDIIFFVKRDSLTRFLRKII
jgi:hypothetical protein